MACGKADMLCCLSKALKFAVGEFLPTSIDTDIADVRIASSHFQTA